jgi:dihydroorotase
MQKHGVPLLVHGETTGEDDIFERERIFIEKHLSPLNEKFPDLKIVLEHITTQVAVDFVSAANESVAATITPHHLMYNRNDLLAGGIKPHLYCMPILKAAHHREALITAATSGNPKFFLGTDSAPHARQTKESACGCAGVFSALTALELYATVFEQAEALDKLEAFASFYGADFYGLPRNEETVTLVQEETMVPEAVPYVDGDTLIPMQAGETLNWRLADTDTIPS